MPSPALFLAFVSACFLTLALPNEHFNYGLSWAGFFALVPLYIALLGLETPRQAFLTMGLFGALAHGFSSYWLWFFRDFRFWTLGSTIIAYGIVYGVGGLYLHFMLKKSLTGRPLVFALYWTLFEYFKSIGFLGYPWGLLPYTQTSVLPMLQIADITGVYGLSFVLALSNAAIAELVHRPALAGLRLRFGYAALAASLAVLTAVYGFVRLAEPLAPRFSFGAVLVQQNADPWQTEESIALARNVRLARGVLETSERKIDMILFSETSLRRPYEEYRSSYYATNPDGDPFLPFIKESGAWFFVGAPLVLDWETRDISNAALLIAPDGTLRQSYAKIHPVPFAESIPFWEFSFFRAFMQNVVGLSSGWTMGSEYSIFELPLSSGHRVRFGAPICFEDAFPGLCGRFIKDGAELLINLTDDSWSRTRSAEIQHWAVARFRAIEFRTTLLRSTNAGVSCVVDPHGRVLDELPLFETVARRVEVPIYGLSGSSLYSRFGDFFALLCFAIFAVWALALMIRDFRFSADC